MTRESHNDEYLCHCQTVSEIVMDETNGRARAVVLNDGTEIRTDIVLSNATAKVTYLDLLEKVILLTHLL